MKKIAEDITILQLCTKKHNHMRYSQFLRYGVRQNFLPFWAISCPVTSPPTIPKKQKEKKMKKTSGYVIILILSNKKHDHMMYAYSDMECGRHNCHFRLFICSFAPLLTPKIKIQKKCQKTWIYYLFTPVYHKSRSYDVWFLRYEVQQTEFCCHLRTLFALLPHRPTPITA